MTDRYAFVAGHEGPVAWDLGDHELELVRAALDEGEWIAVGERWPVASAPGAAQGVGAVIAAPPGDLARIGHWVEEAGATWCATLDWPIVGWAADHELQVGDGRLLTWYRLGERARRAQWAESHQLAVMHPQYDGFLIAHVLARRELTELRVVADDALAPCIDVHMLEGGLRVGQVRALDIELHPGAIPKRGVSGMLRAFDGDLAIPGAELRLTLATSARTSCSVSGDVDGPLAADQLELVAQLLLSGKANSARVAAAIDRAEQRRDEHPPGAIRARTRAVGDALRRGLWGMT